MVVVVTFTGTLTYTGKHGQTAVRFCDVVDQFHHIHGFAYTGTAEQAYFTAFSKRTKQVDHFNPGFQQFGSGREFVKFGRFLVDCAGMGCVYRAGLINRITQNIHNPAQRFFTDRYGNRCSGIVYFHTAFQAV